MYASYSPRPRRRTLRSLLFDGGSHRSFITSKAASRAKLPVVREDWLSIHTFGQRAKERGLRDVVEVTISPVKGEKEIKLEAYVVPEISKIPNVHVEIARDNYPHFKDLWFSDVNIRQEELEIDVLVGADYLWDFQSNRTIRGKCNEPVAVETELGWVLSGPMQVLTGEKQQSQVETVQGNLDLPQVDSLIFLVMARCIGTIKN